MIRTTIHERIIRLYYSSEKLPSCHELEIIRGN